MVSFFKCLAHTFEALQRQQDKVKMSAIVFAPFKACLQLIHSFSEYF